LDRRLGGLPSRSGLAGEEKNSQLLPGFRPPIVQLVAQSYTTELSRLFIIYIVQQYIPFSQIIHVITAEKNTV
jgi:hypothetical protein